MLQTIVDRRWTALLLVLLTCTGCGKNFYAGLDKVDDKKSSQQKIRDLLDEKDYDSARILAEKLLVKEDTNATRILLASARLGQIDAALWGHVQTFLPVWDDFEDDPEVKEITGDGSRSERFFKMVIFYQILNLTFGETPASQYKWRAINDTLAILTAAPEPSEPEIHNATCYIAALNIIPTMFSALDALSGLMNTSFEVLTVALGTADQQCGQLDKLDGSLAYLSRVDQALSQVLDIASTCQLLSGQKKIQDGIEKASAFETAMTNLVTQGDKGCNGDAVPFLTDGSTTIPACLLDRLRGPNAQAGDGKVSACEIIFNCTDPESKCFAMDLFDAPI